MTAPLLHAVHARHAPHQARGAHIHVTVLLLPHKAPNVLLLLLLLLLLDAVVRLLHLVLMAVHAGLR